MTKPTPYLEEGLRGTETIGKLNELQESERPGIRAGSQPGDSKPGARHALLPTSLGLSLSALQGRQRCKTIRHTRRKRQTTIAPYAIFGESILLLAPEATF